MSGYVRIDRPVGEVFEAVVDEASWNPAMTSMTMHTPPPLGVGSRYSVVMGRGRGMPMNIEITDFDPPRRLGSRTSSAMLSTTGAVACTPDGDATLLAWEWDYRLHGAMRLAAPLFALLGGRWERRNWILLRDLLESRAPGR